MNEVKEEKEEEQKVIVIKILKKKKKIKAEPPPPPTGQKIEFIRWIMEMTFVCVDIRDLTGEYHWWKRTEKKDENTVIDFIIWSKRMKYVCNHLKKQN